MASPSLATLFNQEAAESDIEATPKPEAQPEPAAEIVEAASEQKPAETAPEQEKKAEAIPEPTREEAKPEAEAEVKKEEAPKPGPNWDDDANPYLKRYRDAGNYANRVNQQNITLQKELHDLRVEVKKLNGTYDPQVDEKPEVDPNEAVVLGEQMGRGTASLRAAYDLPDYGSTPEERQANVNAELTEFNRLFDGDNHNPIIQARVLSSPMPVLEALNVLEEYRFTKQRGRRPAEIIKNLRAEWEADELPKLREQVSKEIMARVKTKEKEVKGIGEARDAGRGTDKAAYHSPSLDQILRQ